MPGLPALQMQVPLLPGQCTPGLRVLPEQCMPGPRVLPGLQVLLPGRCTPGPLALPGRCTPGPLALPGQCMPEPLALLPVPPVFQQKPGFRPEPSPQAPGTSRSLRLPGFPPPAVPVPALLPPADTSLP